LLTGANQASTVTQVAGLTNGSRFAAKVQRNSGQTGTTSEFFSFPLDTDELNKLKGNAVVLSFTVKAGANWSPTSGALFYFLASGTGGSPAKRGSVAYTGETLPINSSVNLTPGGAAVRVVSTISSAVATNINQAEMGFSWSPTGTAGADDSFTIDDVQVEVVPAGIAAVNPLFERSDFIWDLQRCQRFLPVFNSTSAVGIVAFGQAFATTGAFFFVPFHQQTRVPVTGITFSNLAHFSTLNNTGANTAITALVLNANVTLDGATAQTAVASGLVAGNASALNFVSVSGQLIFTGAEI
jgi:hypothetical protein